MKLEDIGWSIFFEGYLGPYRTKDYSVMRITRENREKYVACNQLGEYTCEVTGKYRFDNSERSQFPTVGDWVVTSTVPNEKKAMIHAVLPRKSYFCRKVAGENTEEQAVAANIDTVFIISGLDSNYNLRRIERFLSLVWDSGAEPVLILNKSDLCSVSRERKEEVETVALGADVHVISALKSDGIDILKEYLQVGKTVAFLGSSGVGKSTLINSLLGTERMKVSEVSELGSRGSHTTTFRELIFLPEGGMVIDTPGMREIQVWGDDEGVDSTFKDINELAKKCRFSNCSHQSEPDCAVIEAIEAGSLDPKRFQNYLKLKREFAYLADRQTMKASALEKSRWKNIRKFAKQIKKDREY